MKKVLLILGLLLACLLGAGIFLAASDDPYYRLQSLAARGRFGKYDATILQAARRNNVPPELIKAVVWRESRFHPDKVGTQGERGLMQITEGAAADWAKSEKIETFVPTDLFDPKTNIEAGTWYLAKALRHWSDKDNPIPFGLAEYNAGRTRVKRWVKDSGRGESSGVDDLHAAMDFPTTKSYIAAIVSRYDFYRKHGEFAAQAP